MPFLEVHDVHKDYEGHPLLRGVSFGVEQEEIAGLLGASGSGKTTLLRIIAGLERAESGRVLLDGEDVTDLPTHRRGVVLMFQDYALFPHRTVAENVAFGLRMQGRSRREIAERVREMLETVGLAGFESRDVNELSGGERQRVALARSLAPAPRLLLLDEPLGALDRNLRERLLEELPAILHGVGVTAITVTHDQEEAFAVSDRAVLLHEGVVVQQGRPEVIYNDPVNEWVARFLGLTNLFPARTLSQEPPKVETPFGVLQLDGGAQLPREGGKGTLLVHPWGVELRGDEGVPASNRFTARVKRRTFHGAVYRLTLSLPGGELELTRDIGRELPEVGDEVQGCLHPAALRWL
jgi:ABC-type Fe3+/spermidine/putrescine transport system ATPase subunit